MEKFFDSALRRLSRVEFEYLRWDFHQHVFSTASTFIMFGIARKFYLVLGFSGLRVPFWDSPKPKTIIYDAESNRFEPIYVAFAT